MHSILCAMSQFDMEALVVSPPEMSLLGEFKTELDERNVLYREVESVEKCIADADVIYMEPVVQADCTQARVEAGGERGMTPAAYRVTRELLRDKAKSSAIILHSLPRMDELPPEWTAPGTTGTGMRHSTASSCGWRCSRSSSAPSSRWEHADQLSRP